MPNPVLRSPPVVAVFLDGLGAESVERMPFLAAQPSVRRMETELGYSITCHASMYTGVRPDRHGLWFVWQRGPDRSPFRWLRPFRFLDAIDNLPMHVAATKVTRRFVRTTSWFGVPYPVHVPWRYLPDLDISERKLWTDAGYLDTAPTIFDLLRAEGTPVEIVGLERGRAAGMRALEDWHLTGEPAPMTYLFAGDVDHASHAHGQRSDEVTTLLARIDGVIEAKFEMIRRAAGDATLVVWSDHGHHDVQKVNPFELLERHGIAIRDRLHVIDTNFIRLWIDDERERQDLARRLNAMDVGWVLTDEELARYRVRMDDDRYGNLVFYLELPYAFSHTIWGFGRRLASAHGYRPEHPGSYGTFVSTAAVKPGDVQLVDVAPSLLEVLGAPVPDGLDGASVWRP